MTKKDKSTVDDIDSKSTEELLNGDGNDVVADDSSEAGGVGTPTYEELFDKNEELEKQLLRSNADLDNALKRTSHLELKGLDEWIERELRD